MTQYDEGDLRLAALELLAEQPAGLTTSDLRSRLRERLAPAGHDATLVESRGARDTYFDQKVRNLTSHRDSSASLSGAGFVTYAGSHAPLVITAPGIAALAEARRTGRVTESEYRERQWNALLAHGGPTSVAPDLLRELGIYRGGHGVWTDAPRTSQYGPDLAPLTVSLLHTGTQYAEDLTAAGLTFHYPTTERSGRDAASIEATKRAARLSLPIFVITNSDGGRTRAVQRAIIVSWDDEAAVFELAFGPVPREARPLEADGAAAVVAPYRRANEEPATAPRDPFEIDPNAVDRALGAHARTQNALADWVQAQGFEPVSPIGGADFDLAWEDSGCLFVAEVKSLNRRNEARQLRLGLGQVLHYQAMLEEAGRRVRPVLAVEREPLEGRWLALCSAHGVALVWPGSFDRVSEP
ncbi:MAG: hypothetical protein ABSE70_07355 [Candidatus Limnocylindrales bacterium]